MIDEINLDSTNSFAWGEVSSMLPIEPSPHMSVTDNISADLKKYFFHKMEKKGISKADEVFDQYLKAGFLPKAAIALTDRKFFPTPHKSGHGSYLRNVIGDELFQKEQAVRKDSAGKSKKHEYTKQMQTGSNPAGQYVLGIVEMAAGVGLMAAGAAVEIGSLGTLTVGVAFEEAAALALVADGFARTMNNRDAIAASVKDISIQLPKYDPLLDIVNKPKENPRNWDEPGSPPIRGDHLVGDGTASPHPGFEEWLGTGDPISGHGSWVNQETDQSLHPDLHHRPPEKPHWDYKDPNFPKGAKLYPDGTWVPK